MNKPHPAWVAQARTATPWGAMRLARSARGLAGVWLPGQAHEPPPFDGLPDEPDHPWFQAATEALNEWMDRDPIALPPLDPLGTPFQLAVWALLREIPRGGATSYGELAARLGTPTASRAVGAAVGRNPIGILVPCHRVIGKDGSLTGYAGGLELKTKLLQAEGHHLTAPKPAASRQAPRGGQGSSGAALRFLETGELF